MEATTNPTHQIWYEDGLTRDDLTEEQFSVLVRIWTKKGSDVTVGRVNQNEDGWIYAETGKFQKSGDGHVIDPEGLYHFPGMPEGAKGIKPEDL